MNISISTEEEILWTESQIDQFNANRLSLREDQLGIYKNYVIKEGDVIAAGIKSCVYFQEVLHVAVLCVAENYRHKGLGSRLLKHVEHEARIMGATIVHLDTFDFQAKDFYLKQGYEIFGVLEECPKGHQRYYLKKSL